MYKCYCCTVVKREYKIVFSAVLLQYCLDFQEITVNRNNFSLKFERNVKNIHGIKQK